MVVVLPNQGAELGKSLAILADAIGKVARPDFELMEGIKKLAITNPQVLQNLSNLEATAPGTLGQLGLKRLIPIISNIPESPDNRFARENKEAIVRTKGKQLRAEEAEADLAPLLTELRGLSVTDQKTKLMEKIKANPKLANYNIRDIAFRVTNGEEVPEMADILTDPQATQLFGIYQNVRERELQFERQRSLIEERDAAGVSKSNMRLQGAMRWFERTGAGDGATWQSYLYDMSAADREKKWKEISGKSKLSDEEQAFKEVYQSHKKVIAQGLAEELGSLNNRMNINYSRILSAINPQEGQARPADDQIKEMVNQLNDVLAERGAMTGKQVRAFYEDVPKRFLPGTRKALVFRGPDGVVPEAEALFAQPNEAVGASASNTAKATEIARSIISIPRIKSETNESYKARINSRLDRVKGTVEPEVYKIIEDMVDKGVK